jgi:hypothetical protein
VNERLAHGVAVALFLAGLAGVQRASAQEDLLPQATTKKNDHSPQNAAFEVRFGPYYPKIDDGLATPVYDDFFGGGRRFMFGFEVDWQAYRIPYLGTVGIGGGWGYTQMSGTNLIEFTPEGETPPTVAQQSSLNIMPLHAVGVLRIDALARSFAVPLVPYGKLGVVAAFWWVNDGIGTATDDAGTRGQDISMGTQAALGGMFLLDVLEPSSALAADVESGVNNSYLFFEWSMTNYGGDQMNVGSNNWVTGLAFEM